MTERGSIQFVIGELSRFTEKKVKALTLNATANLVEDTPRKTGWARANWVPSIGRSTQLESDLSNPDSAQVQARAALKEAGILLVVSSYKLSDGAIYVTNNVPYILPLNDGHSQQAPAGFVQSAILRAVRETL